MDPDAAAMRSRWRIVVALDDGIALRRVVALAAEIGATVVESSTFDRDGVEGTDGLAPPFADLAIVVDADAIGSAGIVAWRERFPEALLVGVLLTPERARWSQAEQAGCDVVVNRGAVAGALRARLERPRGGPRRWPVADSVDVAGRLGLLARVEDAPPGPVALYRLTGSLVAIADRCPHAGARLSDGEVEDGVVTCPRHGSQFDLRTGERVRGPADTAVGCYDVVEEGGRVWLCLD